MGKNEEISFDIKIKVQPGASKSEIVGMQGDSLKVRIKAPPVEGKANKECIAVFAKVLGLRKRDIDIVTGDKGRDKLIRIYGLVEDDVRRILNSKMN